MSDFSIRELVDGYAVSDKKENERKLVSVVISGSFAGRFNNRLLKILFRLTAELKSLLAYTSIRGYGLFLMAFGLVSLIVNFLKVYLGEGDNAPLGIMIAQIACAIIGILSVVSDKPLAIALQDFALTDFIFFEFFCIKRVHRKTEERGVPSFVGMFLGMLLAVLTWFVPPNIMFISIIGVTYAYVVMLSPEFSMFSTFLLLPYLSMFDNHEIILSFFVVLNLISFARKVVLGRRVLYIEQYDVCILIFLLFVLISGIFVKGTESFTNSLVMIVLASGYTLSGCIVANRRLADCLINALIFSSVPVSLLTCVQFVLFISEHPISEFRGVSATFSSVSVLSVYLLISLIFSVYFVKSRRSRAAKSLYGFISVLILASLAMTADLWVMCVAIIAFLAYIISKHVKLFGIVASIFALLGSVLAVLPGRVIVKMAEIEILAPFGLDAYASRWAIARKMLLSNFFTGIGIGDDCFVAELGKHGTAGAYFTDSGSFFLEVAVEAGIFALIALIFIFIIRARHRIVYVLYVKNSQMSTLSKFTTVATASLIGLGAFNYIWSDMSMYFLFWCIFGVGSAALRISKQEHDDRMGYYSDGRSADASSIDVNIS